MANKGFQLTAELVLVGPVGVDAIAAKLDKLSIPAKVNKSYDKLAKNIAHVRRSTQNLSKAAGKLGTSFGRASTGAKQVSTGMQRVQRTALQAVGAWENFGRTVGFVTTRLIGFRIASALIIGFGGAIRTAVGDAIDFERQLVKVAQVTGKGVGQLTRLTKEIDRLSVKFGVSSKELIGVSKTLSQAGLSARDTRISLEALAKSTLLPTFQDLNQTTEGAIAIFNQFGIEAKDLLKVLSSLDAVTGKLAVEASDVVVAVKKAGGIFAALNKEGDNGVESFNEFLAIFASVRQTTRESAQNIAVGLRTIFARIQRPATIEFLKQFGIQLEDVGDRAGQLKKPLEILDTLSNALGNMSARNLNIGQIVQSLGGTRQVAKVLPLLFQQQLRQRALRIATEGSAQADEKFNKALGTLSTRIGQVREEFTKFIRDLVQDDTFQVMTRSVLDLTQGLIKLAGALKPIIPFLAIGGAATIFSKGILPLLGKGFLSGFTSNPLKGGIAPAISTTTAAATKGA